MNSRILNMASRMIFPIGLLFAVHILFRGHNAPGGGFIAGLCTATVIGLQYLTFGTRFVEDNLWLKPYPLIVSGLAMALITGLGSFFFNKPFLTAKVFHWHHIPIIGEMEFATALFFDLGVFFTVVGVTVGIFQILAQQKKA